MSCPYAAERLTHMSRQGESHLYSTFKHKALHTKCSRAVLASGFILVPLLHLPLATASCVTEKYGIFIPYLRPSLCSFTVPWKPNFYSCQQITFRQTEECVVAWISSFFFFFKRNFLQSKKRLEDLFLKIISPLHPLRCNN